MDNFQLQTTHFKFNFTAGINFIYKSSSTSYIQETPIFFQFKNFSIQKESKSFK